MKKIEFITEVSESFVGEWEALWKKSNLAHFFNSYKWFLICKTVFPEACIEIITVRENGKLIALLPIEKNSKYGISLLVNPGEKFVDRSAILLETFDKATVKSILNALKKKGNFFLSEVPQDIVKLIPDSQLEIIETGVNLRLPFENNPLRFVKGKNMRKIKKIYEDYGSDISFVMNRGNLETLKLAMKIDSISYREKKNIGTFNNQLNKAFFKALVEIGKEDVGVNVLYYKKKAVAYEIGVRSKKTYGGINKSFDNAYAFLTPGKILAHALFSGLYNEGIELFDFSRGDDMLKRSFTNISQMQYDVYYTNSIVEKLLLTGVSKLRKSLVNNKLFYTNYRRLVSLKK